MGVMPAPRFALVVVVVVVDTRVTRGFSRSLLRLLRLSFSRLLPDPLELVLDVPPLLVVLLVLLVPLLLLSLALPYQPSLELLESLLQLPQLRLCRPLPLLLLDRLALVQYHMAMARTTTPTMLPRIAPTAPCERGGIGAT
jgi:hypothetical protein